MKKAEEIFSHRNVTESTKYLVNIIVWKVSKSKKFPDGVKSKFRLIHIPSNTLVILIDNHEPFGFHEHTKNEERQKLMISNWEDALDYFLSKVKELENEQQ